ncbi:hypothetical protein P3G55_04550 [Leptospira sp. 96542]|nr:hypothetical protein [Leptospira sp. 96542]
MENLPREKRDLLDLLDTYKYMNQAIFWDFLEMDGRWDFANGWLQLNLPEEEWRVRASAPFPPTRPEGGDH